MKSFLKQVLAVIVGLTVFQFISLLFTFIFLFAFIGALKTMGEGGFSKGKVKVEDNTVLWVDLSYAVPERDGMTEFNIFSLSEMPKEQLGLQTIVKVLEKAKTDSKIKGIYMDLSTMPNGYATVDVIRNALLDFKESGKFIVAYGEVVGQKAYYLASVADEIYINPKGLVELRGIGSRLTFFHRLLTEKLDADVRVFKVGTFKSAVEPFIREDISDANREQLEFLLGGIKADFLRNISNSRDISEAEFDAILNELKVTNAQDAVDFGLIDGVKYYDEVLANLFDKTGAKDIDDFKYIAMSDYAKTIDKKESVTKNKIAVVYAYGDIVDGNGELENIGSKRFAKIFRELRNDEDVKAIVIRVNSPGGSALASEVMWREIELAKASKPIVVSMGDVAASGGYYIACNANRIFAEENTITGSIGVFGLLPNFENFFKNKLGITFDDVKLNDHATFDGITKGLDDYEALVIQKGVNEVYEVFTGRVAEGRNMSVDEVKKYAEGRVWTGEQAMAIGLVDEMGGLDDAIKYAVELAELEDYRLSEYPKQISPFEFLLKGFGDNIESKFVKRTLGDNYIYVEQLKSLEQMQKGVQARMPYVLEIK
jgi:protease IV